MQNIDSAGEFEYKILRICPIPCGKWVGILKGFVTVGSATQTRKLPCLVQRCLGNRWEQPWHKIENRNWYWYWYLCLSCLAQKPKCLESARKIPSQSPTCSFLDHKHWPLQFFQAYFEGFPFQNCCFFLGHAIQSWCFFPCLGSAAFVPFPILLFAPKPTLEKPNEAFKNPYTDPKWPTLNQTSVNLNNP